MDLQSGQNSRASLCVCRQGSTAGRRRSGYMSVPSPFKPDLLRGRVALVTGGASGIGYEVARQLGLHGAKLVLMGRRQEFIDKAVAVLRKEGVTCTGCRGDVRSREDAEKAVATCLDNYGRLDILVNGAAGNFLATAEGIRLKGFKTVMEIDAIGVFNLSTAAFAALRDSGHGVVINISATLHYGATWYQAHASAAKAAIDSITRSLGLEWGAYNIRVIGIAPGPIAGTPGMTKLAPGDDASMVEEAVKEVIPIGRMGTTQDIAYMATFLCSDAASFVTGETVVVDGGQWMWKPPMLPREMVEQVSRGVEAKSRAVGAADASKPTSKL